MPSIIKGTCPYLKYFYVAPNDEFYPEVMSQVKHLHKFDGISQILNKTVFLSEVWERGLNFALN